MTDYRRKESPYDTADSSSDSDGSDGSLRLYKMRTVNSLTKTSTSTEELQNNNSPAEISATPVDELGDLLHNLNITSVRKLLLANKNLGSLSEDPLVPGHGQTTAKDGKIVWDQDGCTPKTSSKADQRPRVDWSPVKNILKSILKNPTKKQPTKKAIQHVKFEENDTIQEFEAPESQKLLPKKRNLPFNFVIKRIGYTSETQPQLKSIFNNSERKEKQQMQLDVDSSLKPAHCDDITTVADLYWKLHELIKVHKTLKLVDMNSEFIKKYRMEGKPYERFKITWVALCAMPLSNNLQLDTKNGTISFVE